MQFLSLISILAVVSSAPTVPVQPGAYARLGGQLDKFTSDAGTAVKNAGTKAGNAIKKGVNEVGPTLNKAGKVAVNGAKNGAILVGTGAALGVGLAGSFVAMDALANHL